MICKGYGLNEVHILNQNSKNWTTADYLEGYCNLGYSQYVEFKKFIDKHEINTQIAMYLLSGADSGDMVKTFNSGQFKLNKKRLFYTNYKKNINFGQNYDVIRILNRMCVFLPYQKAKTRIKKW